MVDELKASQKNEARERMWSNRAANQRRIAQEYRERAKAAREAKKVRRD